MVDSDRGAPSVLEEQAGRVEWNLKHSSVAPSIPISVLDTSLALLSRARAELAAGNPRTAEELIRRAGRPLSEMRGDASLGRHPDRMRQAEDLRTTLASIIEAAERIAAEQSVPAPFVAPAREELRQGEALLAGGDAAQAQAVMNRAYLRVQQGVAGLLHGNAYYIAAPDTKTAADWQDGLRRVDERRMITSYLLLEARAEGIDVAALQAGVREAEAAVAEGARLADARRWDQALQRLDRAYARYEASWRSVGIDW